ncbi:hypothetical protein [Klebsiella michiganensis]|uniref:hypothetical protein n=1 Tax=Klebsiella michiganensis TaxID=1134687 RepID=UPI000FF8E94C|nr:hypothetical protein [Klebsiella michiganensis]QAS68377.1 hypothetical protein KOCBH_A00379 [Klebsiella michiganensis]
MFLVNMTAYLASPEQREMGVIDVDQQVSHALRELLTFNTCPSEDVMTDKAKEFAEIATSLCNKYKADGVLVYAKTFFYARSGLCIECPWHRLLCNVCPKGNQC